MKFLCLNLLLLNWALALNAQTNPPAVTIESTPAAAATTTNDTAATNAPAAATAPDAPPAVIEIHGDKLQGNLKSGVGSYIGNASVNHPDLQLRCEVLHFELPRLTSSNYNRITALTNVVIDFNRTNHLTGDKAVYTKTLSNGLPHVVLELIGNACLTNPAGYIDGANEIVYDPISGDFHYSGGRMFIVSSTNSDFSSPFSMSPQVKTGAPTHRTNSPAIRPQIHP